MPPGGKGVSRKVGIPRQKVEEESGGRITNIRTRVKVVGLVQGVGFRPFVWREATARGLRGFVGNDADGVVLEVEGAG